MASSSSSLAAQAAIHCPRSGSGVKARGQREASALELHAVDQSEYIVLDKIGHRQFICTNLVIGEKLRLPPGEWDLEQHDGQCALFVDGDDANAADGEIIFPADRFKQVYRHESGELFVRDKAGRVESWDVARSRYSAAEVVLRGGRTAAQLVLRCFVFLAPRECNQRMFWECAQLYDALKLDSNKGFRSLWVAKSKARWLSSIMGFCDMKASIMSNHGNSKEVSPSDEASALVDKCLPAFSLSTYGWLLLLARFAYSGKQSGGFEKKENREAAREIFLGMLHDSLTSPRSRTYCIEVTQRFECAWPRPQKVFEHSAMITVNISAGKLDLSDLQAKATGRGRGPIESTWWSSAKAMMSQRSPVEVTLRDFLARCCMCRKMQPFMAQLFWHLALELEEAFAKRTRAGGSSATSEVADIRFKSAKEVFGDNLDLHLAEYTLSTVAASHGHKCFMLATDKGTIHSLPLQVTVIGVPTGEAFVCVPQVDYGFDAGCQDSQRGQKRLSDGTPAPPPGSVLTDRHRAWLRRGEPGVSADSWRPKKVHRLAAKHWLAHTDSQIRHSTVAHGWAFFQHDGSPEWADSNWAQWPHMACSLDQGSDGLCATFALEYKFQVCMSRYCDFSHGSHKDLQASLKACSMWDFILVFMIHANVPHRPDRDDQRFHQLRGAMARAYADLDETTPLFASLAAQIHKELRDAGHIWAGTEDSLEKEVWDYCRSQDALAAKDYRLNLNRFQGTAKRAGDILNRWSLDTWERTYLCLELDWLQGSALRRLVLRPGLAERGGEEKQTTSAGVMTIEDRTLRACLQNAMVISCMFVTDILNRRRLQIFHVVGSVGREWHGQQSHQLRSSGGSVSWLRDQVGRGQFFEHLNRLANCSHHEETLMQCGFWCGQSAQGMDDVNDKALVDNEMADMLGQFSMALCVARQRRCLWLVRGWPHRMPKVLEPSVAETVCSEFMEDLSTFEELSEMPNKLAIHKTIQARHCMNLVVNKQYAAGLRESRGVPTDQFKSVVREQRSGPISTQVCEDLIGVCKNNDEVKGATKFRRPQVSMAKCVTSNTLTQRHQYTPVGESSRTIRRDTKLGKSAWQCTEGEYSLPFQEIATTASSAPWHSPGATNVCTRDADLELLRQARASSGGIRSVRYAWLGEIFDLKNRFLFKVKRSTDSEIKWFLAGSALQDSAVIGIPMREVQMLGSAAVYFEPMPMHDVELIAILDLSGDSIVGCSYEWKSWLSQLMEFGRAKELAPAIRLFRDGPILPIRELAARCGFWSLGKSTIPSFCAYWGVSVASTATLFDAVAKGAQGILNCSDDEVPDICHKRVIQLHAEAAFSQEVAQRDAAIQTFDMHDHEEAENEKVRAIKKLSQRDEFLFAYAKTRASVKGKRKRASPKAIVLPSDIQQCDAKKFVPPGGHIWVGRTRGEWAGHYRPYRRVSALWSSYGQLCALKKVLRDLWNQHNEYHALPKDTSPIIGLFDEVAD